FGDGTGNFSAGGSFGGGSVYVTLGDVNGDGKLDVVTVNGNSSTVWTFLNDGAGHFTASSVLTLTGPYLPYPTRAAPGDVNADGKLDMAVAEGDLGMISMWLGDGAGHFTADGTYGFGKLYNPSSVALVDVNGDGHLDIVSNDTSTGYLYVM